LLNPGLELTDLKLNQKTKKINAAHISGRLRHSV